MKTRLSSRFAAVALVGAVGLATLGLPAFAAEESAARPVARTTSGDVRGYVATNGINAFKGIPYGDDTAKRRFRAPVPPVPWAGVREAVQFASMAPQPAGRRGATAPAGSPAVSEDCLHLNVWTPALHDGPRRPVLVYFHGGAYNGGSVNEDLYDGTRLSRRGDVVVVTVNHRLNGFGFLYLAELAGPEFADSGNAGMLDLVLALQWVRDNIREFGGDPGNVTLFGQSGGGAKCATLMAMPAARGLFHRVWTMSGQQLTGRTRAHATETARTFLLNLGLTPNRIGELSSIPRERLVEAMRDGTWVPVTDGGALPRDPFAPDASPLSAEVPMVLGNTHDETRNLIGGASPALFSLSWEALPEAINRNVKQFIGDLTAEKIVEEYRRLYSAYSPSDVFFAATTAARSWKGMVIESERRVQQGRAPTFVYYVNWPSPADGGKWRAPHTIDIPLVFDNVAQSPYTSLAADAAQKVADEMSEALIAFARTGNPATSRLPWARFELERRPTMIFDTATRVESDPRGAERKLFESAVYLQPGT
jgi:para-nitrobenzyl esterase